MSNTAKTAGGLETQTAPRPTGPTTSDASKTVSSSPRPNDEPQLAPVILKWLQALLAQGAEAAHVLCQTESAGLVYQIAGFPEIHVDIGARNFIVIEMPNDPMDGAGYTIVSRKLK